MFISTHLNVTHPFRKQKESLKKDKPYLNGSEPVTVNNRERPSHADCDLLLSVLSAGRLQTEVHCLLLVTLRVTSAHIKQFSMQLMLYLLYHKQHYVSPSHRSLLPSLFFFSLTLSLSSFLVVVSLSYICHSSSNVCFPQTEDYLKRKIRSRPERSELIRMHILEGEFLC